MQGNTTCASKSTTMQPCKLARSCMLPSSKRHVCKQGNNHAAMQAPPERKLVALLARKQKNLQHGIFHATTIQHQPAYTESQLHWFLRLAGGAASLLGEFATLTVATGETLATLLASPFQIVANSGQILGLHTNGCGCLGTLYVKLRHGVIRQSDLFNFGLQSISSLPLQRLLGLRILEQLCFAILVFVLRELSPNSPNSFVEGLEL